MDDQRGTSPNRPGLRPRGWPALLAVALIVLLPIVEIWLLVLVGREIGLLPVLLIVFAGIAVGGWLIRRRWRHAWNSLREAGRSGDPGTLAGRTERDAARSVADTAVFVVGGCALMFPGLITDLVGLVCLIPVTRKLPRSLLQRYVDRRVEEMTKLAGLSGFSARRPPGHGRGDVVPGEVVDEDGAESSDGSSSNKSSDQPESPLIISADGDENRG